MTIAFNLPLPVNNGAGAAVDISTLGAPLTLTCVGQLAGANIAIEASNDGGTTWSPLYAWQNVGGEKVIPAAVQWMRTNVSGRGSKPFLVFSANLDVAGPGTGMTAASLPMPVLNGAGAAVDTSAFEQLCTFVCTGAFAGCTVAVQISEDNVGWSPLIAFGGTGGVISKIVNAKWMRVFVSGRESGGAFSGLMAVGSAAVGDAPASITVQEEGVDVVDTATINFVGTGVTVTDVAGVATVTVSSPVFAAAPSVADPANGQTTWSFDLDGINAPIPQVGQVVVVTVIYELGFTQEAADNPLEIEINTVGPTTFTSGFACVPTAAVPGPLFEMSLPLTTAAYFTGTGVAMPLSGTISLEPTDYFHLNLWPKLIRVDYGVSVLDATP